MLKAEFKLTAAEDRGLGDVCVFVVCCLSECLDFRISNIRCLPLRSLIQYSITHQSIDSYWSQHHASFPM